MPPLTTEEFISRARRVHGNKYDYALVEYSLTRMPVKIICRDHGEFEQKPTKHLDGHGCKTCGRLAAANARRLNAEEFIAKAKRVHGDKYDYSLVSYARNNLPVTIVCPAHGEFEQKPQSHLQGSGCRKCADAGEEVGADIPKETHMHIWQLKALKLSSPHWEASTYRGDVIVRADTEANARRLAAKAFGLGAGNGLGREVAANPWYRPWLVAAGVGAGSQYGRDGEEEIL